MSHCYSLVHLTNISCPPPEFIRTAAAAGYDAVSLRTIPLGLPGERPYDLAHDPQLLRETRLTTQDIILAVGYENTSYFYRIFRERFGATPREYRREKGGDFLPPVE